MKKKQLQGHHATYLFGFLNQFVDENDFNKKLRALRKYCMGAYKYLIFEFLQKEKYEKQDGNYKAELPVSEIFKFVFGKVELKYSIRKGVIIFEDISPADFLLAGQRVELDSYRGCAYRNQADIKKIDFYYKLKGKLDGRDKS